MKATDLMSEDWVQIVPDAPVMPNEYHRIDWIRTGEIGLDNRKIVTYPYIQPIPLTPEILERNGFVFDKDRKAYLMGLIFQLHQRFDGSFYLNGVQCLSIGAVHELQHALKLCGIEKEITL